MFNQDLRNQHIRNKQQKIDPKTFWTYFLQDRLNKNNPFQRGGKMAIAQTDNSNLLLIAMFHQIAIRNYNKLQAAYCR